MLNHKPPYKYIDAFEDGYSSSKILTTYLEGLKVSTFSVKADQAVRDAKAANLARNGGNREHCNRGKA